MSTYQYKRHSRAICYSQHARGQLYPPETLAYIFQQVLVILRVSGTPPVFYNFRIYSKLFDASRTKEFTFSKTRLNFGYFPNDKKILGTRDNQWKMESEMEGINCARSPGWLSETFCFWLCKNRLTLEPGAEWVRGGGEILMQIMREWETCIEMHRAPSRMNTSKPAYQRWCCIRREPQCHHRCWESWRKWKLLIKTQPLSCRQHTCHSSTVSCTVMCFHSQWPAFLLWKRPTALPHRHSRENDYGKLLHTNKVEETHYSGPGFEL